MLRLFPILALAAFLAFGGNPDAQLNVNSRYTVESVRVSGRPTSLLSQATRRELNSVVGQRLDHNLLDTLASRLRKELRVPGVAVHVAKGTIPEQVTVEFAIEGGRRQNFDLEMPKGVYHSRQGWSGGINATTLVGGNRLGFGLTSDNDSQVERFAGLHASLERKAPGLDRATLRFDFESYHLWNESINTYITTNTHFSPDLFRARQNFQPSFIFQVAEPLTVSAGISVEQLTADRSGGPDALVTSVVGNVRFRKSWKDDSRSQQVDAAYGLRSATIAMGGDYSFARHTWNAAYRLEDGRNIVVARFQAGDLSGQAPVYDHFVLGNASTLRGYNRYELDPMGGDRMVHGSLEYSYARFQVFYDAGVLWLGNNFSTGTRQSAGFGYGRAGKDGFIIALAFPLRTHHIDPMIIAGFNF